MSWYNHMLKSQEMVRERNRREERRQQGERYGPQFVAKYQLAALDKEKKIIEKELERIRKGIHKTPKHENSLHNKANHILSVNTPRFLEPKHERHTINPEYSKEEDHLYDAIIFLQNNPSALVPILSAHAQSDAYLETLERITPRLTQETQQKKSFVPKYLTDHVSKSEKADLLNKYESLLHRHSPILRRNSPLTKRKQINSPVTHRDSPLLHDGTADKTEVKNDSEINWNSVKQTKQNDVVDGKSETSTFLTQQSNEDQSVTTIKLTTPRTRRPLSISRLADDGITSARENVSKRLTGSSNGIQIPSGNVSHSANAPPTDDSETASRPKGSAIFPSVDAEVYNPDGSLRTVLNIPEFETRWEEAKKARYIRTKELLERDRELSVDEIFEKHTDETV